MKHFFFVAAIATLLRAQPVESLGIFEGKADLGAPALKGSVTLNAAAADYRITAAGANIWAKADEGYLVWKRLSGDWVMTATMRFPEPGGSGHRKAGIMARQSLAADAPYLDAIVHGDGLTQIQFREAAGDITRSIRFPESGPVHLKLEKVGNWFTMSAAREGQPLRELGAYQLRLTDPLYVGLVVCSHDAKRLETAVFSDVTLRALPAAKQKK